MWTNLKESILILHCRHQGYTETDIPTHTQIQKCLVEIGDKERSFIGSKQWIGSTEVGFVLDRACEVQSKFLSVSSGDEMSSKGRELSHHFKTQGTPIMIGIIYSLVLLIKFGAISHGKLLLQILPDTFRRWRFSAYYYWNPMG